MLRVAEAQCDALRDECERIEREVTPDDVRQLRETVKSARDREAAFSALERHLARERGLRTAPGAADNVLYLKNALVRYVVSEDAAERAGIVPVLSDLLHLAPDERSAIEVKHRDRGSWLDAELPIPFFG